MKKIIDGKRYNTDTAEEIATWSNGCNYGDFDWCRETLYKTSRGAYFLHGEGGARTQYSRSAGTNWVGGGEDITPQTPEEARSWLENMRRYDALETEFPETIEDA